MVKIGYRPILWHVMKYYAHFGHKDFVLCLGYKADVIKEFFLTYEEWKSNDFTLSRGGRHIELVNNDIADWSITFVDTGLHANIGQRLLAVRQYVEDEEIFLANYADGLTDLHLPDMVSAFQASGKVASFLAVPPAQSFHLVNLADTGDVTAIRPVADTDLTINGGYFVFRRELFDYIYPGESREIWFCFGPSDNNWDTRYQLDPGEYRVNLDLFYRGERDKPDWFTNI